MTHFLKNIIAETNRALAYFLFFFIFYTSSNILKFTSFIYIYIYIHILICFLLLLIFIISFNFFTNKNVIPRVLECSMFVVYINDVNLSMLEGVHVKIEGKSVLLSLLPCLNTVSIIT